MEKRDDRVSHERRNRQSHFAFSTSGFSEEAATCPGISAIEKGEMIDREDRPIEYLRVCPDCRLSPAPSYRRTLLPLAVDSSRQRAFRHVFTHPRIHGHDARRSALRCHDLRPRPCRGAGLILYPHGQMTIANRSGLENAACECYRATSAQFDKLFPIRGIQLASRLRYTVSMPRQHHMRCHTSRRLYPRPMLDLGTGSCLRSRPKRT